MPVPQDSPVVEPPVVPDQTLQPGFLYRGDPPDAEPFTELNEFLSAGTPLLVFTQGSTAVHNPRDFYDISVKVAKRLGILMENERPAGTGPVLVKS